MSQTIFTAMCRGLHSGLALLALNALGLCNTWIVDKSNGPGTNFIDIAPAIAASAAGDVIIVRPGTYNTFTLTRGITILGQGNVLISYGGAVVSAVPAGEVAALWNLHISPYAIQVSGCAGTVLLQRVDGRMSIQASADVRIREASAQGAVQEAVGVIDSRVQVAQSSLLGAFGSDADCSSQQPASAGRDGLVCSGASRLHLALSTCVGGEGGSGDFDIACNFSAASGGNGITASGPAAGMLDLILTRNQVFAGYGGDPGGPDGKSFRVGANATAWSAQTSYSPTAPFLAGGTLIQLPTTEPTLELIGTPAPGGMITLRLRAEPGCVARLNVGRAPIVQLVPGILVEALVQKDRSFDRGVVPPSGIIDSVWGFQASAPSGKLLIFQARLVDPIGGTVQRSNSIEAVIP